MITKRGIVSGTKMTGTVTVTVHRHKSHSLYRKQYRVSTKFLVDPAGFDVGVGDEVEMSECRPISKRKYFKISKIIKSAPRTDDVREEEEVKEAMHRRVQETKETNHFL